MSKPGKNKDSPFLSGEEEKINWHGVAEIVLFMKGEQFLLIPLDLHASFLP